MKKLLTGVFNNTWGYIPTFLNESDPRSTIEQLDDGYISGWQKFDGFTLNKDTYTLTYPEDPPLHPIDVAKFRDDIIAIYPHSWVMVLMPDGKYEICRMD